MGKPALVAVAIRSYDTTVDDLWEAITTPERLARWFLPVEGDLKLVPTESTQLAQPNELPMPVAELPALPAEKDDKVARAKTPASGTDAIQTGSVAR